MVKFECARKNCKGTQRNKDYTSVAASYLLAHEIKPGWTRICKQCCKAVCDARTAAENQRQTRSGSEQVLTPVHHFNRRTEADFLGDEYQSMSVSKGANQSSKPSEPEAVEVILNQNDVQFNLFGSESSSSSSSSSGSNESTFPAVRNHHIRKNSVKGVYQHCDGRREVVEVIETYSNYDEDGGSCFIYIPSLKKEKEVIERSVDISVETRDRIAGLSFGSIVADDFVGDQNISAALDDANAEGGDQYLDDAYSDEEIDEQCFRPENQSDEDDDCDIAPGNKDDNTDDAETAASASASSRSSSRRLRVGALGIQAPRAARSKNDIKKAVREDLINLGVYSRSGQRHDQVAEQNPERVPIILNELVRVKRELEVLKDKLLRVECAKEALKDRGMPDFVELVVKAIYHGEAPQGNIFWPSLQDKLVNTTRGKGTRKGSDYNNLTMKLLGMARVAGSGTTAIDIITGANSGEISNFPEFPTADHVRAFTKKQHCDPDWKAGFSASMAKAFLDDANELRRADMLPEHTAADPCPAVYSFDATDTAEVMGFDPAPHHTFTGGELWGGLGGDAENMIAHLQEQYCRFATAIESAQAAPDCNTSFPVSTRKEMTAFLEKEKGPVQEKAAVSLAYVEAKKVDYQGRNAKKGQVADEVGNQKYFMTTFLKRAEQGRLAIQSVDESIVLLSAPLVGVMELVILYSNLKKIVLELRTAATNYYHGMLQSPCRRIYRSVVRLYFKAMTEKQVTRDIEQTKEKVAEATGGCVVVKFVAYDGAHEAHRLGTAHAKAVAAKSDAQAVNTAVEGGTQLAIAQRVVQHSNFIMENMKFEASAGNVAGSFSAPPVLAATIESDQTNTDQKPGYLVGRWVEKSFGADGNFIGDVTKFSVLYKDYTITYEDGDCEELSEEEVKEILVVSAGRVNEICEKMREQRRVLDRVQVEQRTAKRRLQQQQQQGVCVLDEDDDDGDSSEVPGVSELSEDMTEVLKLVKQQRLYRQQQKQQQMLLPAPAQQDPAQGISEFWKTHGQGCHGHNLSTSFQEQVDTLNRYVPLPLTRTKEEVVFRSPLFGADNCLRLPPALNNRLLLQSQKEQLVTIYRNHTAACRFVVYKALQARGVELDIEPGPLESSTTPKLTQLCKSLDLSIVRADKSIPVREELSRRVRCRAVDLVDTEVALQCKCGRTAALLIGAYFRTQAESKLRVQHALAEALVANEPNTYNSEIKVSVLSATAANVKLACMTREARFQGGYLEQARDDEEIHYYDPDHLHHNLVSSILKQPLDQEGEGWTSKECVLPVFRLLEAARKTGDQITISCLEGNYDGHSHAATRRMLTSKALVKELKDLGYNREATILRILGNACEAWSSPHQSEATRSQSLHLLSLLIYRLFGNGILSVDCLRSEKFGGLPTKQWLNMLANADARRHTLRHLDLSTRARFCDKAVTTRLNESSFSLISNNSTSGLKTDPLSIQQRCTQLDVVLQHKFEAQEKRGGFGVRFSKRQRKLAEGTSVHWHDEYGDRAHHDKDLLDRAAQHTGGHNTKSIRDFVKSRTGT